MKKLSFVPSVERKLKKITPRTSEKIVQHDDSDHNIKLFVDRLQRLEKLGMNHPKLINRAFAVWGSYNSPK